MKKLLSLAVLATMLNVNADVDEPFADKLLLYFPNRFLDLTDTFTLCLGFGPAVKGEVRATRAVSFGGGIGATADLVKAYNRQYGAELKEGWDTSFFWMAAEDTEIPKATRGVQKYWYYHTGYPSYHEEIYNYYDGARDYWEFGIEAAVLFNLHAGLHPVEVADFFTGLVFIDLKGDDLTMGEFE